MLAATEAEDAAPILVGMVEGGDDEVALAAVDALRNLPSGLPPALLTSKASARLDALSAKSKLGRLVVDELHKRLATGPAQG